MNHRLVRAALPVLAVCLSLPSALSACSPGDRTAPQNVAAAQASASDGKSSDRSDCYESEILALREQLLRERADRYVSEAEAQARLDALERALAEAQAARASRPCAADTQPAALSADPTPPDPRPLSEPAPEPPAPAAVPDFTVQDGAVTVTRCTLRPGGSGIVTIPESVGGLPVTRIADGAFRDTAVTAVTLPDTLTEIGWFAFSGCALLEAVTLPASVTDIGYGAFDGCPRLTLTVCPGSYAEQWARSFGIPTA